MFQASDIFLALKLRKMRLVLLFILFALTEQSPPMVVAVLDRNQKGESRTVLKRRLLSSAAAGSTPVAPRIVPRSGAYHAAIGVTVSHPSIDAQIHCTTDGTKPSTDSDWMRSGSMLHVVGTYDPSIVVRCVAVAANAVSDEAVAAYEIQMGTYEYERSSYTGAVGRAYLVPYYRGGANNFVDSASEVSRSAVESESHSSKLASVDLNTSTFRSVRLRGVDSDFAEFFTYDIKDGLQYQRGVGPYRDQVRVHDLFGLRGFFGGFVHETRRQNETERVLQHFLHVRRVVVSEDELTTLISEEPSCVARLRDDIVMRNVTRSALSVESRGFLSPFYNGTEYSGKVVRLALGRLNQVLELEETTRRISTCCVVNNSTEFCSTNYSTTYQQTSSSVELTTTETYHNGTSSEQEVIDLTTKDPRLKGFVGGFASGDHAYFVPHFDGQNPGHVVARVRADGPEVDFVDLWDVDTSLAGYFSGFAYKNERGEELGFLVPYCGTFGPVGGANTQLPTDNGNAGPGGRRRQAVGGDQTVEYFHGKLVRLRLGDNFTNTTECVDSLDLTSFDPDLKGFAGGVVVGRHGLLVPYKNADDSYFGKVVRIDLETFTVDSILDLTRYPISSSTSEVGGSALRGFVGAVAWGRYAVLVPHRHGLTTNKNVRSHSGVVVRIDMNDFTLGGVRALDISSMIRQQVPSAPDNELRGFLFGFSAGDYVYLVPHFSRDFYGKLVRIDMRDFDVLAQLQESDVDVENAEIDTFTGLQYVDLERHDRSLVGFAGGFVVRSPETTTKRNFLDEAERRAWWQSVSQGGAIAETASYYNVTN